MERILATLLLMPWGLWAQAQDITGVWTGHIETSGSSVPFEVVIMQDSDHLRGYSLMTFTLNGKENVGIKSLLLKNKNGGVSLEDDALVYNNYSTPPKRVKLTGYLTLSHSDSALQLRGSFKTRAVDFRATDNLSYSGTIELVRQQRDARTRLVVLLEQLNLAGRLSFNRPPVRSGLRPPNRIAAKADSEHVVAGKFLLPAAMPLSRYPALVQAPRNMDAGAHSDLQFPAVNMDSVVRAKIIYDAGERKTAVVRSVYFKADSLVLSLYDNGIVDGDTVSIVVNGRVILANQGLTTIAIRYVLRVTPELGDSLLITMVAENLGSIPPNTGLLVVQDGEQRNEIMFSGDMQMSSAVLFRRKHP